MSRGAALGGGRASIILARVAMRRLLRSKTLWIAAILGLCPVAVAAILGGRSDDLQGDWRHAYELLVVFMVVVPPLLVAAAVSEEIEDRTYTYLWSRPLARWSMVVGKLAAGWPLAAAILGLAALASFQVTLGTDPADHGSALIRGLIGCTVGVLGVSLVSAGWAALAPTLAQRLTYAYLFIDMALGAINFSLQNLSITFHIRQLAGVATPGDAPLGDAIWCVAIGAFWLSLGLLRLRRAEYTEDR